MKKIFLALIIIMGVSLSAMAQYAEISSVRVITSNGTFERSKISLSYRLTSEGMEAVYEKGQSVIINITANYPLDQLLKTSEKSGTFYPVNNGNGRRKNAEIVEFECVDHETALRLARDGVSTSDFSIRSSVR